MPSKRHQSVDTSEELSGRVSHFNHSLRASGSNGLDCQAGTGEIIIRKDAAVFFPVYDKPRNSRHDCGRHHPPKRPL